MLENFLERTLWWCHCPLIWTSVEKLREIKVRRIENTMHCVYKKSKLPIPT